MSKVGERVQSCRLRTSIVFCCSCCCCCGVMHAREPARGLPTAVPTALPITCCARSSSALEPDRGASPSGTTPAVLGFVLGVDASLSPSSCAA